MFYPVFTAVFFLTTSPTSEFFGAYCPFYLGDSSCGVLEGSTGQMASVSVPDLYPPAHPHPSYNPCTHTHTHTHTPRPDPSRDFHKHSLINKLT